MATSDATTNRQADTAVGHRAAERVRLAAQATHQIESLLYALRRELNQGEDSPDTTLMMSMVVRLKELNSVAMSMLDDDHLRETTEMKDVVWGSWVGDPA